MLVVKGTLTELKLVLKGYKPGEIEFVEQDTKMTAYSSPNEMTGATDPAAGFSATELFESKWGGFRENPPWHLDRIDQRDLPTDEGFLAEANL